MSKYAHTGHEPQTTPAMGLIIIVAISKRCLYHTEEILASYTITYPGLHELLPISRDKLSKNSVYKIILDE